jgi:hypothetical protein
MPTLNAICLNHIGLRQIYSFIHGIRTKQQLNVRQASILAVIAIGPTLLTPAFAVLDYGPSVTIIDIIPKGPAPNLPISLIINVTDIYGGIIDASVEYRTSVAQDWNNGTIQFMSGTPDDATFKATIPPQHSDTVYYRLTFRDNYDFYSVTEDSISISTDFESPMFETPSISPRLPAPWDSVLITSRIQDYDSGISNVTLFYSISNSSKDYQSLPMWMIDEDPTGYDNWDRVFRGAIPPAPLGSEVLLYVQAVDNAGRESMQATSYVVSTPPDGEISISADISRLEPGTINNSITLEIDGRFPTGESFVNIDLIDKTLEGRGLNVHLLNHRNFIDRFERTTTQELYFLGSSTAYPFDSYSTSFVLDIPFKNVQIQYSNPEVSSTFFEKWGSLDSDTNLDVTGSTTLWSDTITVVRNPYTTFSIMIPIIAIFFLLGGTLLLPPTRINERLLITFGIFAAIFSIVPLINGTKPFNFGFPTFADYLVGYLIVSTVSLTLASIVSHQRKNERWERNVFITILVVLVGLIVWGFFTAGGHWLYYVVMPFPPLGLASGVIARRILSANKAVDK